jgi:hypothetical protein
MTLDRELDERETEQRPRFNRRLAVQRAGEDAECRSDLPVILGLGFAFG